jgi:hypothetical protein
VVGSRAYGLDDAASDTDRRGIYLPPAELHWSLGEVPEQLEDDVTLHRAEYERLRAVLEDVHRTSTLPEVPTGRAALDDLLLRLRLAPHTAASGC